MQITERQIGSVTILDVSGRIMFADGEEEFHAHIKPIVESGGVNVLLNMALVPLIDSAGIGEVVRSYAGLKRRGGALKLLNLSRRVHEALTITKLLTVLEAFDSETEAIESFSRAPRS
jgi:anti-sigma B factor antagonist